MNLIISINNDTTYTPEVRDIVVQGADWLPTQELTDRQPIANGRTVVGWLSGAGDFKGSLTVRYPWVAPGPQGADVNLTFHVTDLDGKPLVGFGHEVVPPGALANTELEHGRLDGEDVLLLHIRA